MCKKNSIFFLYFYIFCNHIFVFFLHYKHYVFWYIIKKKLGDYASVHVLKYELFFHASWSSLPASLKKTNVQKCINFGLFSNFYNCFNCWNEKKKAGCTLMQTNDTQLCDQMLILSNTLDLMWIYALILKFVTYRGSDLHDVDVRFIEK